MKLSIALTPSRTVFAPLLYAGDVMRGIRRAAELGYDGVELNIRDPAVDNLDQITAAVRAYGLEIVSLGTGQAYLVDGLSSTSPEPTVRALLVERLKRHVDFAARVGAQVVIGGVRGRLEGDPSARRAGYECAVGVVRQVIDYAAPKGVTITVEPINRYETNFLNTVDETLTFLQDVGRSGAKLLLDTFHMNIEEVSIPAAFERARDRLSHVHLVDSNRRAPGMGHVDFPSILAVLREMGYRGYLSGEFLPLPDDDVAAASNVAYLGPLIREG